jgi:predicted dehydrogenase
MQPAGACKAERTVTKLGIGIVGCGNIAATYMRNAALFSGIELRGCADLDPAAAQSRAAEFGTQAMSIDQLMGSESVDLVLNLTVPMAHHDVTMSALTAGKHVFSEKPLGVTVAEGRRLVEEARSRNLLLGSAPDTFLGAAGRHARKLIDSGAVGRVVAGTAFMFGRGMEHWHPAPQFYYQPGGGPVLDMGPYYLTMLVNLLGPAASVTAVTGRGQTERVITAEGPLHGTTFPVGTPTTALSLIRFASGALITFGASWDVFRHSNHPIELHGTEGSIRLPDPDTFGGTVSLSSRGAEWLDHDSRDDLYGAINWPHQAPDRANYRMLGVADLARSLVEGRAPRASGELALHVLEIMEAILASGENGETIPIASAPAQPRALGDEEAVSLSAGARR